MKLIDFRLTARGAVIAAVCVLFLLSFCLPAAAQNRAANALMQNLVEEFLLADAVRAEDQGELQLTLGAEGLRHRGSDADMDIEYGITNRLQFTFEMPYGIQERSLSDVPVAWSSASIGGLYQFIRSSYPFALAAALAVDVPVSSRGDHDYEPEVLAAKAFGRSQVHFSGGGELSHDDDSWFANVAWARPLSLSRRAWLTTFELNGRRQDGQNGLYFTPGVYRHFFPSFSRRVEFGAGVPVGAGPIASHFGLAAKMTIEFGGDDD